MTHTTHEARRSPARSSVPAGSGGRAGSLDRSRQRNAATSGKPIARSSPQPDGSDRSCGEKARPRSRDGVSTTRLTRSPLRTPAAKQRGCEKIDLLHECAVGNAMLAVNQRNRVRIALGMPSHTVTDPGQRVADVMIAKAPGTQRCHRAGHEQSRMRRSLLLAGRYSPPDPPIHNARPCDRRAEGQAELFQWRSIGPSTCLPQIDFACCLRGSRWRPACMAVPASLQTECRAARIRAALKNQGACSSDNAPIASAVSA